MPQSTQRRRRFTPPPPPPRRRLPVRQRGFWAGIAAGLVASAFIIATAVRQHASPSSPGPWGTHSAQLRTRLRQLGLPALSRQGTKLHTHQHLDVYVNGKHITVPAGIGIGSGARFYSPLHTHDARGIIHVESQVVRAYTLGQFFGVWGVRLTPNCVGAHCGDLHAFVNGREVARDPRRIRLRDREEIALVLGKRPPDLPSTYDFPNDL